MVFSLVRCPLLFLVPSQTGSYSRFQIYTVLGLGMIQGLHFSFSGVSPLPCPPLPPPLPLCTAFHCLRGGPGYPARTGTWACGGAVHYKAIIRCLMSLLPSPLVYSISWGDRRGALRTDNWGCNTTVHYSTVYGL